jgi:bla regulator protein BlaR1
MFAIGQSNFLQALGWAVLNSLWQMALLWVVYQLITAIFRTIRSSQKSALATTLLFAGFAWFVFTFFVILADVSSAHTGYSSFIMIEGNSAVNNWLYTTLPIASLVYLVLLILPLLNFIRNYRYVQVIRRYGLIKADVQWRMFVQKMAAQMGINKPVHVWMSEFVTSPLTIGYLKPIILLPVAAISHLSAEQTEAVLLHELSHIRRFDFLINLITKVIQTILYYNPFVKAFANIIEEERERNCDELVLQFQYEPHGYASALLALERAAHVSPSLAVAASGAKKNNLLTRIETIMGIRKKPVFSFNKLAGVVAALFCFISLNALLLLSKPGDSKTSPGLLTDLSGPFHLFAPAEQINVAKVPPVKPDMAVEHTASIVNVPKIYEDAAEEVDAKGTTHKIIAPGEPVAPEELSAMPYINVNFSEEVTPQLDKQEEEQVKEAMIASKKVMTEDQWKAVEKSIADAMTIEEKELLKNEYKRAMNQLDWNKMEEKLKIAYEKIDWNQINSQLNTALVQIRIDSLQQVYTTAIAELSSLEKELKETKQCGIPDSDITLKTLSQQRKEAQKAINTLKAVRDRKIIRL